jgi:hypothetical protein
MAICESFSLKCGDFGRFFFSQENRLYVLCGIDFLFGRQVAKYHQKETKSQLK